MYECNHFLEVIHRTTLKGRGGEERMGRGWSEVGEVHLRPPGNLGSATTTS